MAVIDFPTPRKPTEAQSETIVALLDALSATRLGDVEGAQQNMIKAWDASDEWSGMRRASPDAGG